MAEPLHIGGAPLVVLRAPARADRPAFVEATVAPGRGFMLLQAKLALPSGRRVDLLHAPGPAEAAESLNGGEADFAGNGAFAFGGAILAPFANRIRGRPLDTSREIETLVDGTQVRLPRNWGGQGPGAETYAMHGLILSTPVTFAQTAPDTVVGRLSAGSFAGRWPGRADMSFEWSLAGGALTLRVEGKSRGPEPLPFSVGWHPYFRILSGRRTQARLRLPARRRVAVNNYDEVLPTGELLDVRGTPYDFRARGGRSLGDLYLDDCFTDLGAARGLAVAELFDPAADLALRIAARAPPVRAIQVYAPPDKDFVVIEPQFNLPDPYGSQWACGQETGMLRLPPGTSAHYEVRVTARGLTSSSAAVTDRSRPSALRCAAP